MEDTGQLESPEAAATPEVARKSGPSRGAIFLVVLVLIAAAFGGGAFLGFLQLRGAREAWQREKADLTGRLTSVSREMEAARSREVAWQVAEGLATIRIHLAEKNFGLAKDAVADVQRTYVKAAASLEADARERLASLGPLLSEIVSAADSLSPDARSKTQEATDLVHRLLESVSQPSSP